MYPDKPENARQKALAAIVVLLSVALVTASVKAYDHKPKPMANPIAITRVDPASQPANGSSPAPSATSGVKDGTYSASAGYNVPDGFESIKVNLTVKNGVVTGSSIQNSGNNPTSASIQDYFASQYKSQVVGKSLSGLQIDGVAGASDTSQGFDDALQQIQNQAQA